MPPSLLRRTAVLLLGIAGLTQLNATPPPPPNIILFIVDDVSWNDIGATGNPGARTPNLDRLAAQGRRFDQTFLTASSCSPSRASIITGRYPHNTGLASELHRPIAAHLPWFPELLREAGYYTALSGKKHMERVDPVAGESPRRQVFDTFNNGHLPNNHGAAGRWLETFRGRAEDRPFFGWFAAIDAHRQWDGDVEWDANLYGPKHTPETVVVPPYLVDDDTTRGDLASYYNEITRFDYFVGQVVDELVRAGEFDHTFILVMADNGRPFPRAKTRLHDSGMKTFLIASWPDRIRQPGTPAAGLISAIDIAPTLLTAAGLPLSATMQGLSFLPLLDDPTANIRSHAFSEHNWHDQAAHGRAVRSAGYLYISNHRTTIPWVGPMDSVTSVSHASLRDARDAHRLTPAQSDLFTSPRPATELYFTATDPLQLHNLSGDPAYAEVEQRLAALLHRWRVETGDDVPIDYSRSNFDLETGLSLHLAPANYYATVPGQSHDAAHCNAPGPR